MSKICFAELQDIIGLYPSPLKRSRRYLEQNVFTSKTSQYGIWPSSSQTLGGRLLSKVEGTSPISCDVKNMNGVGDPIEREFNETGSVACEAEHDVTDHQVGLCQREAARN